MTTLNTWEEIEREFKREYPELFYFDGGHEDPNEYPYARIEKEILEFFHTHWQAREDESKMYAIGQSDMRRELVGEIKGKKKHWHLQFEGCDDFAESIRRRKFNEEVSCYINGVLDDLLSSPLLSNQTTNSTVCILKKKDDYKPN